MTIQIRKANLTDIDGIIAIDTQLSEVAKPEYWREIYGHYQTQRNMELFLVAKLDSEVVGFIMGEVKAWEYGSSLCGWVFAIGVKQDDRLEGVGSRMLDALCANFRKAGVTKVRTMVARQNHELLAFFRSQGMMAGPYLQLEKELE